MSSHSRARRRRSTSDVQSRILAAARAHFARKGYDGASVREIADSADVYEPMVYRRYPGKAELFEAAVLGPLDAVIAGYLRQWNAEDPSKLVHASTEELVRSFVPPLFRLMVEERELVVAFMAAQQSDPDLLTHRQGTMISGIRRLVDVMCHHVEIEAKRRPLPDLDARRALLISFGMLLGVALIDESAAQHSVDAELVEEMVKFTLWGVAARPGPSSAAPDAAAGITALLDRAADAERRAVRAELEVEQYRARFGALD